MIILFGNRLVPIPSVSVTALVDNPTVGKLFQIECNVTVARGIIGNMEIIWKVNGTTAKHTANNITWDGNSQNVLHRDIYNISSLQMSHNNTVFSCEAMINSLKANDSNITLTNIIIPPTPSPTLNGYSKGMLYYVRKNIIILSILFLCNSG